MDKNKLAKLQALRYQIVPACGWCEQGHFVTSGGPFGECRKYTYQHQKHSGAPRQLSVHRFGVCADFAPVGREVGLPEGSPWIPFVGPVPPPLAPAPAEEPGLNLVEVHLCCNDEQGDCSGRLAQIEVPDQVTLEHISLDGAPFAYVSLGVRIGDQVFAATRHGSWVGSAAWDSVLMSLAEARRLIECAQAQHEFSPMSWVRAGPFSDLIREPR